MENSTNYRYVVSGATGFIGRSLVEAIVAQGHVPLCLSRRQPDGWLMGMCRQDLVEVVVLDVTDKYRLLAELSSRLINAHVMFIAAAGVGLKKLSSNTQFNQRSVEALDYLAQNINCRTFHLRYVSTIKVSSQRESGGKYVRHCPYAVSKMQAEVLLLSCLSDWENQSKSPCSLSIVRAPATFGVGDVNFQSLIRSAQRGVLICLPKIYNRSCPMIYVDRLAQFLVNTPVNQLAVRVYTPGYELDLNTIVNIVASAYDVTRIYVIPPSFFKLLKSYSLLFRKTILEQRLNDLLDSQWKLDAEPQWLSEDLQQFSLALTNQCNLYKQKENQA